MKKLIAQPSCLAAASAHFRKKRISKKRISKKRISKKRISKEILSKRSNKKQLNKLFKTGGKCKNIPENNNEDHVIDYHELLYFVIINTNSDEYIRPNRYSDEDIKNKFEDKLSSRDNVKIYCIKKKDYFEYCDDILNTDAFDGIDVSKDDMENFTHNHIKLSNGVVLLNVMRLITGNPGYLLSRNENEIKTYTLLINLRNPVFAYLTGAQHDGGAENDFFPNYYHVIDSSDEIPTQFVDDVKKLKKNDEMKINTLNTVKTKLLTAIKNEHDDNLLKLNNEHQILFNKLTEINRNVVDMRKKLNIREGN